MQGISRAVGARADALACEITAPPAGCGSPQCKLAKQLERALLLGARELMQVLCWGLSSYAYCAGGNMGWT